MYAFVQPLCQQRGSGVYIGVGWYVSMGTGCLADCVFLQLTGSLCIPAHASFFSVSLDTVFGHVIYGAWKGENK